jgi:hypothetical protein
MQGFLFRPPPHARLLQGLLPILFAVVVTGMAARLTLQNDPPPDRLLKGAAIIVGFDLLAVVTAVMWWRAYVVFDHAGVRYRNFVRERSVRFEEIEAIAALRQAGGICVVLKRRRGWGLRKFSKIAALTTCFPFPSRAAAAQYRGLAEACRARGAEAGTWPS